MKNTSLKSEIITSHYEKNNNTFFAMKKSQQKHTTKMKILFCNEKNFFINKKQTQKKPSFSHNINSCE